MSYWDTSTLVKLYAKEPDSAIFENHLQQTSDTPTTSRIALYEARATFRRKESEGILQIGAADLLYNRLVQHIGAGDVRLIEIAADVEREYGQILNICCANNPPVPIRTLDTLHLASAKAAFELEIVTTDKRMREVAKLLRFDLFPP